jgi:hypothetical protein
MRKSKEESYLSIFKIVINQGPALFNIDYLMQSLKALALNDLKNLNIGDLHLNQSLQFQGTNSHASLNREHEYQ